MKKNVLNIDQLRINTKWKKGGSVMNRPKSVVHVFTQVVIWRNSIWFFSSLFSILPSWVIFLDLHWDNHFCGECLMFKKFKDWNLGLHSCKIIGRWSLNCNAIQYWKKTYTVYWQAPIYGERKKSQCQAYKTFNRPTQNTNRERKFSSARETKIVIF